MGYAFNELVAVAVLYLNPGINKERYVRLLDRTHSACFFEYKPGHAMDYWSHETQDKSYHNGLEGLAKHLCLNRCQDFIDFQKVHYDEHGFIVRPPDIFPADNSENPAYAVVVHEGNELEEPTIVSHWSQDKVKPGDCWEEMQVGDEYGRIVEVIEQKEIHHSQDEQLSDDHMFNYESVLRVRKVKKKLSVYTYLSRKDAIVAWPQFHPRNEFDWSLRKGHFLVIGPFQTDDFYWKQINGRYFIDEQTFDRIPSSVLSGSYGYTDLLMTAEAIKRKAWKVLSYHGLDHFSEFLSRYPYARKIYEKSVRDSHTSLMARSESISNSDLLRWRAGVLWT